MATAISLIPTVTSAVTLALTTSPFKVSKEGPKLPPVVWEDTWAEGRDTEGAKRTNSRARNGEGSLPLVIVATTETLARDALKSLQKTIYACRSFGGVLRYADGIEQVDFQLEAISVGEPDLEMVHKGIVRVNVAFTAGPFAHLPNVVLISTPITDAPTYAETILADVPSLYWRLGVSGTTDQSGNGRDGTGAGGITIGGVTPGALTGDVDTATDFDGTDDKITSTYNPFTISSVRTYEAWVYRDTAAAMAIFANSVALSAGNFEVKLVAANNNVEWYINYTGAGGVTGSWTNAHPGTLQWVHMAMTVDDSANTATLYINGVSKGAVAFTGSNTSYNASPGTFQTGAWATSSDPFNGKMDEVAVYERALTAAEILEHYNLGITGPSVPTPQLSIEVPAVPGSAPALAHLEITDTETTDYDDVEIGGEFTHYNAAAPADLLLADVAELVTTGMAGVPGQTRTGDYGGNGVVRATLFPGVYVGVATSGILTAQKGNFRVKGRFYGTDTGPIYVRLGQRKGSGPYTYELPRRLQGVDNWYELDLGVMRAGDDGGIEFVIEATSDASGDTIDLDYLRLVPTEVTYARAYGKPITPQTLAAYDGFDVTSADLTGDTAPLGGNWAHVAGDASVWTVPASSGWALRQPGAADGALSGGLNGALARLGTGTTAESVRAPVYATTSITRSGVLMRYQATNEFVVAYIDFASGSLYVLLRKVIAGAGTQIGSALLGAGGTGVWVIDLTIDANGKATVSASAGIGSTPTPQIVVTDADLATAGTLGNGGYGLYSGVDDAFAYTRHYDFTAYPAIFTPHALDAGGTLNLTHDTCTQEPALYGAPPEFEGRYLRLPPGGQENKKGRLIVSARRNDRRTLPDTPVDDRVEATLTVTPRVQVL